jgi:hypothetical protein
MSDSIKMNTKTHKVFVATFVKKIAYAVPIDWDIDDVSIRYNDIYYKDEEQKDMPMYDICDDYEEGEPYKFEEEEDVLEEYFDCEEEETVDIDKVIKFMLENPEKARHDPHLIELYHKMFASEEK